MDFYFGDHSIFPGSFDPNAGFQSDNTNLQQSFEQPLEFDKQPFQNHFQPQSMQPQPSHNDLLSKNIEILSSKLDALKIGIESINQRLANLERIANDERRW